jgi:hypothetical protein
MPRVFPERGLTFQQRLEDDKLMFRAVDITSRQLCVKFVYRQYGEDVHRMLSQNKMAPELLEVSHIDGGPTVIIVVVSFTLCICILTIEASVVQCGMECEQNCLERILSLCPALRRRMCFPVLIFVGLVIAFPKTLETKKK